MKDGLLIVKDVEPGIQEVTLNLEALYPDENERNQFEKRFVEFLNSEGILACTISQIVC